MVSKAWNCSLLLSLCLLLASCASTENSYESRVSETPELLVVTSQPTSPAMTSLKSEGPWLLQSKDNLSISPTQMLLNPKDVALLSNYEILELSNLDGSASSRFLPEFTEQCPESNIISFSLPSQGTLVALLMAREINSPELWVADLITGEVLYCLALLDSEALLNIPDHPLYDYPFSPNLATIYSNRNSFLWSPDATQIAFTAALDSDNTDIYILDIGGKNTTHLVSDSGIAIFRGWAPGGTRVLTQSIEVFIDGFNFGESTAWIHATDGSDEFRFVAPAGDLPFVANWISEDSIYMADIAFESLPSNLRRVDFAASSIETIFEPHFSGFEFNPFSQELWLEFNPSWGLGPITFAVSPGIYVLEQDEELRPILLTSDGSIRGATCSGNILLEDKEAQTTRMVTATGHVLFEGGFSDYFSFSPDHCSLALWIDAEVVILNQDGRELGRILHSTSLYWSPNSREVYMLACSGDGCNWKVFTLSGELQLIEAFPSMSPNGETHLMFP